MCVLDRLSFFFIGERADPCNRKRERERVGSCKSCLGFILFKVHEKENS